MINRLELDASVAERDAMRWSPAGVPIVNLKLTHQSKQIEAGVEREVECEVAALAAGTVAQNIERLALGETVRFSGFIAKKSRHSKALVFHIDQFSSLVAS